MAYDMSRSGGRNAGGGSAAAAAAPPPPLPRSGGGNGGGGSAAGAITRQESYRKCYPKSAWNRCALPDLRLKKLK